MSYILNALKKSEQDRLLSEEKTLFNKISGVHEQKKKTSWLFFLVILNLLFLSYFIWFYTKENNKAENLQNITLNNTHKTDISKNTITKLAKDNSKLAITEHINNQPTTTNSIQNKQRVISQNKVKTRKSDARTNNSINDGAPAKKKQETKRALNKPDVTIENAELNISKSPQSKPDNAIKPKEFQARPSGIQFNNQPISESPPKKKPVPIVALKQMDIANDIDKNKSTALNNSQVKTENRLNQQLTTISIEESTKIENEINTNQPPFLLDLDYEFRRTVPDIKINVFVYSENENKRFIMINMVKFVPGQEISEGMVLNEIRMNSIVVDYNNRIFQINRNHN